MKSANLCFSITVAFSGNKKEKSKKKVTINDDKGSVQDILEEGAKKKVGQLFEVFFRNSH